MGAGEVRRAWGALPEAGLGEVCGAGDPLVLAPHPDDESLGCGGLIARAVAEGRAPLVVVLTDGAGSHPGSAAYPGPRLAAVREAETVEAVGALGLGAGRVVFLREPDTRAPREGAALEAVAARLCALVERHGCTALLASWAHDPHCDHLAADRVARLAAARCGVAHWAYPVWGWTLPADAALPGGAVSGVRVDVGAHMAAKRRAVAAHRSQHGLVVGDDPGGFVLPRALLHHFEGPWEVFLRPGAEGGP
ncbi:MAG: PIG-L deacetylase family protein [Janthinobacterium lividum]